MDAGGINTAGITTSVWGNATRSLTTAVNTFTAIGTNSGSLAINTILDLRPGAGKFRCIGFQVFTATTGVETVGWYDGVTFNQMQIGGANQQIPPYISFNTSSFGMVIKNTSGANVLTYGFSGWDIG